jgi:hypothetical protein
MVVLGMFYLPVNGAMRATDKRTTFAPKPLDVQLQANGFGRAQTAEFSGYTGKFHCFLERRV